MQVACAFRSESLGKTLLSLRWIVSGRSARGERAKRGPPFGTAPLVRNHEVFMRRSHRGQSACDAID